MAEQQTVIIIITLIAIVFLLAFFILIMIELLRRNQVKWTNEMQKTLEDLEVPHLIEQVNSYRRMIESISAEIHDNISLTLTLSKLYLHTLNADEEGDIHDKIDTSVFLIGKAIRDLNRLTTIDAEKRFTQPGLVVSIEEEISHISKTGIADVSFNIHGDQAHLDPDKELIIFRIIQESLNNILKHAQANEIRIELVYTDKNLAVKIEDNGIGFDTSKAFEKLYGQGLKNIKNRSAMLNADVRIESYPGLGTTISITIPNTHH